MFDGTPDAWKLACPVWNGGKSGDNIKGLPIIISGTAFARFADRIPPL